MPRHGRKPLRVVIHNPQGWQSIPQALKTLKKQATKKSFHCIVDQNEIKWLININYASISSQSDNLATINIAVLAEPDVWCNQRLIGGSAAVLNNLTIACFEASKWVQRNYGYGLPAARSSGKSVKGFQIHDECGFKQFPWAAFLQFYEKKVDPPEPNPHKFLAAAAKHFGVPGKIFEHLYDDETSRVKLGHFISEKVPGRTQAELIYRAFNPGILKIDNEETIKKWAETIDLYGAGCLIKKLMNEGYYHETLSRMAQLRASKDTNDLHKLINILDEIS